MDITGNIISQQVTGDTAKQLSDRFGKIIQDRESVSINNGNTSICSSKQLESAVPANTSKNKEIKKHRKILWKSKQYFTFHYFSFFRSQALTGSSYNFKLI